MDAIIEIADLHYRYLDGTEALRGITLKIMEGEKVALVGANGAGKSTLLLNLNGILRGDGRVRVGGLDVNKKTLGEVRAAVGMVFQNPDDQLFSPTVYEDVAFGPLHQGWGRDEVRKKVEAALRTVRMTGSAERHPFHLSGGEKKRIALASVLSMEPRILVLDEPSAGLDPRTRRELMPLLQELPQTTVIATHDLDLAAKVAGRTIVLSEGRVVMDGESGQVLGDRERLLIFGM